MKEINVAKLNGKSRFFPSFFTVNLTFAESFVLLGSDSSSAAFVAVLLFGPAIKVVFFVVTILIGLGGALFAMRRLAKLEPASVFRG